MLPVFAHLGLPEQLVAYPALLELELPARLLRHCAGFAGAQPGDPVLDVLEEGAETAYPLPFIAPTSWRGTLCRGPWHVRRLPGRRALYDRSGRLLLALWRGPTPGEVRALVKSDRSARVTAHTSTLDCRRASPQPTSDLDRVLIAWLQATRRWLRLYTGLSLGQVVGRPGRLVATPTHLDLHFDLDQADVRIRKAGLDLDPGWLDWLGRVFQFHYA